MKAYQACMLFHHYKSFIQKMDIIFIQKVSWMELWNVHSSKKNGSIIKMSAY